MILSPYSKWKIATLLKYAIYAISSLSALVIAFSLVSLLHLKEEKERAAQRRAQSAAISAVKNYEAITKGIMALYPASKSRFYPDLRHEILLFGLNTRPDVPLQERQVILRLRGFPDEQVVISGQSLFLDHQKTKNGEEEIFTFSSEKSPLWIKPLLLDNQSVLIEAGKEMVSEGGEAKYETTQFVLKYQDLQRSGAIFKNVKREAEGFTPLHHAKWWGTDVLIQNYGGSAYQELKAKHKLEFFEGGKSYICFVSSQDYLTWEGGRWKVVPLEQASKNAPLAQVKSIGSRTLEITAWDESGLSPKTYTFEMQLLPKLFIKAETLPNALRLRSGTQVTCLLGKRRSILKQGDWLLKTASGWRTIKRMQEIEDYLNHSLRGELLIFDALQREQGKMWLKGHIFDEMRTQWLPISLPVQENQKPSHFKKRQLQFQKAPMKNDFDN